jgi:hypothetical protein
MYWAAFSHSIWSQQHGPPPGVERPKSGVSIGLPPGCIGGGSNLVCLGSRGNAWPNGRRGSEFRRRVLFLRCLGPVVRGGGCAHAAAWWGFWETTSRATSLAHVLWVVCRYDLLLTWSAAGISPLVAGINRACGTSVFAIATSDFLACPSSLYKQVPRMGAKWSGTIAGRRSGRNTRERTGLQATLEEFNRPQSVISATVRSADKSDSHPNYAVRLKPSDARQ